jgi:hypothetical protein
MNFRRGLFRLWSIFSACWVAIILLPDFASLNFTLAIRHWQGTSPTQTAWSFVNASNPDAVLILIGDKQLEVGRSASLEPFNELKKEEQQETVEEIANELKISHIHLAMHDVASARVIQRRFLFAFIPPIVVLVLGVLFGWVAAGFKQKQ